MLGILPDSSDLLILSPGEEEIQPPPPCVHSSPLRIPGYIYDEQHVPPPHQSLYHPDSPNCPEIEDYIHHDRDYRAYRSHIRNLTQTISDLRVEINDKPHLYFGRAKRFAALGSIDEEDFKQRKENTGTGRSALSERYKETLAYWVLLICLKLLEWANNLRVSVTFDPTSAAKVRSIQPELLQVPLLKTDKESTTIPRSRMALALSALEM
nr:hypothetical protein Iba_chr04bCG11830 [Ipomoea batatas]